LPDGWGGERGRKTLYGCKSPTMKKRSGRKSFGKKKVRKRNPIEKKGGIIFLPVKKLKKKKRATNNPRRIREG